MLKIIVFMLISVASSWACSCPTKPKLIESVQIWNLIFKGTVTEVAPTYDNKMYKVSFRNAESLQEGNTGNTYVYTNSKESSCGYPFEKGKSYLVFAQKFEDGFRIVNACSATKEYVAEEYQLIKEYFQPLKEEQERN